MQAVMSLSTTSLSSSVVGSRPRSVIDVPPVPLATGNTKIPVTAGTSATPRSSGIAAFFVKIEAAFNPKYSYKAYGKRKQANDEVRTKMYALEHPRCSDE